MSTDVVGTENFGNGPYKKPEAGDAGDEWATILESLIDRITTHSHSGSDSKTLTLNISRDTQGLTSPALTWTALDKNGILVAGLEATVSYRSNPIDIAAALPSGTGTFDGNTRHFYKLNDAGEYLEFFPTINKLSATTFEIYTNEAIPTIRIVYI